MRETDNAYSQTDSDTLSETLHTRVIPTTDLAFGRGERYEVAGGQSTLEIFPEHRMSRITTPTSRLELFGSPAPRIVNGQVVISRENGQEETSLSVSPEGTVVFGYVHCPSAPDEPQTAPETAQEPAAAAPAG
jgi:hypothetical protein